MADDVWRGCERLHAIGRTVTVNIAHGKLRQIGRALSRPVVVVTQERRPHAAIDRVRWVAREAKRIRGVGVTVPNVAEAAMAEVEGSPIFARVAAA